MSHQRLAWMQPAFRAAAAAVLLLAVVLAGGVFGRAADGSNIRSGVGHSALRQTTACTIAATRHGGYTPTQRATPVALAEGERSTEEIETQEPTPVPRTVWAGRCRTEAGRPRAAHPGSPSPAALVAKAAILSRLCRLQL